MNLLQDKVCLITGANRGIGRETAKRFAEEGAVLYVNARREGTLDELMEEITTGYHVDCHALYFDVTDEAASKEAMMTIKKEHGGLDVLVNNAGIMRDKVIGMIETELMRDVFDVNVFAVIHMIQLAAKLMVRRRSGCIINVSSIAGLEGAAGQLVYSSSKGAVAALTRAASKELASSGIRVNAVAPGLINTDLLQNIGDEKIDENLKHIKMGRLGEPVEVANVIVFLASDLSGYMSGEVIRIDGEAQV